MFDIKISRILIAHSFPRVISSRSFHISFHLNSVSIDHPMAFLIVRLEFFNMIFALLITTIQCRFLLHVLFFSMSAPRSFAHKLQKLVVDSFSFLSPLSSILCNNIFAHLSLMFSIFFSVFVSFFPRLYNLFLA